MKKPNALYGILSYFFLAWRVLLVVTDGDDDEEQHSTGWVSRKTV